MGCELGMFVSGFNTVGGVLLLLLLLLGDADDDDDGKPVIKEEHSPTSFQACSHIIFVSSLFIVCSSTASSYVSILQYISYGLGWQINIVL